MCHDEHINMTVMDRQNDEQTDRPRRSEVSACLCMQHNRKQALPIVRQINNNSIILANGPNRLEAVLNIILLPVLFKQHYLSRIVYTLGQVSTTS